MRNLTSKPTREVATQAKTQRRWPVLFYVTGACILKTLRAGRGEEWVSGCCLASGAHGGVHDLAAALPLKRKRSYTPLLALKVLHCVRSRQRVCELHAECCLACLNAICVLDKPLFTAPHCAGVQRTAACSTRSCLSDSVRPVCTSFSNSIRRHGEEHTK